MINANPISLLSPRLYLRLALKIVSIAFILLSLLPSTPIQAQPPTPVGVIESHLGYGVHFGPNTGVAPNLVNELGFDWVKIYEPGQAAAFRTKRVLLRHDVTWPNDWNSFKSNLAGFVAGLAGSGIDAIEYGNEPNLRGEWGGRTPNAWEYVQVLRVAYTVTKQVAPNLIVVSAGLAPTHTLPDRSAVNDLDFAREMIENGAGQWFDAFGYHPYGYNMPPDADPFGSQDLVFRRSERIRQIMEDNGVYKQVWLTEFGWLRDPGEDGVGCSDSDPNFSGFAWLRVSSSQQANYLVRAFEYAHENWQWVGPMFVWNMNWSVMGWLPPCDHRRWFGLLTPGGQKTPAFYALASMPHHFSSYTPKLLVQGADQLTIQTSIACLKRTKLGDLTVQNIGYPANISVVVDPANGVDPPFLDVKPSRVQMGETSEIFVNPQGINMPGQYPVYINVRTTINGQVKSQVEQGFVIVSANESDCR